MSFSELADLLVVLGTVPDFIIFIFIFQLFYGNCDACLKGLLGRGFLILFFISDSFIHSSAIAVSLKYCELISVRSFKENITKFGFKNYTVYIRYITEIQQKFQWLSLFILSWQYCITEGAFIDLSLALS